MMLGNQFPELFARLKAEVGPDPRQHYSGKTGWPKKKYAEHRFALHAMHRLLEDPGFTLEPGYRTNVYRCEICDHYHIGTLPIEEPE